MLLLLTTRHVSLTRSSEKSEPTPRPSERKNDIIDPPVSMSSSGTRLKRKKKTLINLGLAFLVPRKTVFVALKVLEKALNFVFTKVYELWTRNPGKGCFL